MNSQVNFERGNQLRIDLTIEEACLNLEGLKHTRETFEAQLTKLQQKYDNTPMLEGKKQLKIKDEMSLIEATIAKYLNLEKKINGILMTQ